LAAGIIAAGFGSGSTLFVPILSSILATQDYKAAFLYTGIGQGLLIILAAQFLGAPKTGTLPVAVPAMVKTRSRGENFTSSEMLRSSHFYFMYVAMLMMGIGGLLVTAQTTSVAESLGISAATVTLALTFNPVANGSGRIFWGLVSDRLGRERTMVIAFVLQSLALVGVMKLGPLSSTWFIVTLAAVFFTWGEVYVLFPSACADFFGAKNASSNYSFLYSTKGVASIVAGGLAAMLYEKTGSWTAVFYGSAVMALLSAIIAFFIGRMPLPRRDATSESPSADLQRA
jgi:OFA family oxalate/formate antiporter-like MFS transporter